MEAVLCLLIFIVAAAVWAFFKGKSQPSNSQSGLYYFDYEEGYDDDSE